MSAPEQDKAAPTRSYTRLLRIFLIVIVTIDFVLICAFSFHSLTKNNATEIRSDNNATISSAMMRSLVIANNGTLYLAWIEKNADESLIIFASSTDFGGTWKRQVALRMPNLGIKPDEDKFDNISLMIDSDRYAHISFTKNLRSIRTYGDGYLWTLLYITNRGGNWSAPEEIKGPWNSDFINNFSLSNTGTYSEGVRGVQIDIDSKNVLHIASRHEGWWRWGGALYHHFKAPNSEWKTEQIHWQAAGSGTYEILRQFYVLRQLADQDHFFSAIGPDANRIISNMANQNLREYRGDVGDTVYDKCWNPAGSTVDCVIQDLPLLFVSPRSELFVFNVREDDKHLYFQKIAPSTFWAANTLVNSEIDSFHQADWGYYTKLLDPIELRANQLVKVAFDESNRPHIAVISGDSKRVYYSRNMRDIETVFVSNSSVRDVDIALTHDEVHVIVSEDDGGSSRLLDVAKSAGGGWSQKAVLRTDLLQSAPEPAYINEINIARSSAEEPRNYTLPFAAVTSVGADGALQFLRIGAIPRNLELQALEKLLFYFTLSSVTVLTIFLASEIAISRKQPFSQRLAIGYLIVLVIFLLAKDIYSWHLRNQLFLAPDPLTIVSTLSGFLGLMVALISNFNRIIEGLKKAAE